jgi:multiple sugar transport system substrate-binding protein
MRRCTAAAALLVLTVSGCVGGATPVSGQLAGDAGLAANECDGKAASPQIIDPPASSPEESRQLVVATDTDTSNQLVRHQLIDTWNRNKQHMPARLVELSESTDQVRADLAAAAQNGFPRYDAILLDIPWIPEFAKEGWVRPLDGQGFDMGSFFPVPWQAGCYQHHLYGVPFTTDVGLLYSRRVPGMSAPTRWSDLAAGPQPPAGLTYTMATQLDNYEGLTCNALEAIWSRDGHFFDGQALLDDNARQGLSDLVRAVANGVAGAAYDPGNGTRGYREADTLNAFASKKVAFMRNWDYARDLIPSTGKDAVPFDVDQLPWPSVLGGWSLLVPTTSPHPAEAIELIKYLTRYDNEKLVFEKAGWPATRPDVYEELNSVQPAKILEIIPNAVKKARPRPQTPYYAQVSQALRDTMSDLLKTHRFDQAAVNAALDHLAQRLADAGTGR